MSQVHVEGKTWKGEFMCVLIAEQAAICQFIVCLGCFSRVFS